MLFWTAPLAVLVIALVYHRRRRPQIHRHGEKLRCAPDALPLLGNAIKFIQPRRVLFDWFVQCQKRFGLDTFEISVPTLPPGVVINDPKNLEFVLKHEESITKGDFFKHRSWDLFGYGIINANGDLWKAQRKAGLKFFSGSSLDTLIEGVMPDAFDQLRSKLRGHVATQAECDLQQLLLDFTTHVVGVMAYDMDIDASSPFSKAFDYASDQVGRRFQNPLYPLTELFTGRQFRSAVAEVKKFGSAIVANARRRRSQAAFESLLENEDVPTFGTLIDSLMDAFSNPTVVADAALNFLSAGRDTTAQSLTWTFYLLMRHPAALAPVRAEIDTLLALTSPSEDPAPLTTVNLTPTALPNLYALYHESLRLHPPVPFELKQCAVATTLPDGTHLPPTSIVVWCLWSLNRSVAVFGEDAESFNPTRWLDPATGKFVARNTWEFPVFNGGPRACLGRRMAEAMAGYVVGRLVAEFEFDEVMDRGVLGAKGERVAQNSLTLPMEGGLPVRVRFRR